MSRKIWLIVVLLAIISINFVSSYTPTQYIVQGNSVFIDDANVNINITPHTSLTPIVKFTSKKFTGDIDLYFGFDTDVVVPYKVEYLNNQGKWIVVNDYFQFVNVNYEGMNKWYYLKNFPIIQNKEYSLRIYLRLKEINTGSHKYWFAVKPSSETLNQAVSNNHLYAIDPWTPNLDNGLVAYYKLNDIEGSVLDETKNYNGTAYGVTRGVTGKIDKAFSFDGSDWVLQSSFPNMTSSMTACAWLNFNGTGAGEYALGRWADSDREQWLILINAGKILFSINTAAGSISTNYVSGYNNSAWHFVCGRANSTNIIINIDDTSNVTIGSTYTGNLDNSIVPLGIGGNVYGSNYTGLIDEVGIWNRSLNDSEITDLYNSGTGESYGIFNSINYNPTAYSTYSETFSANISYTSSLWTSISANLIYNGVSYATTQTGSGDSLVFSRSINVPSVTTQTNYSFYFTVSLTNSTGTYNFNSATNNQTVNFFIFQLCNATYNIPFLNFTFTNEMTDGVLNASNDLTTVDYRLVLGQASNSYLTSNSTENVNYSFCFSPSNYPVYIDMTFKYSASGYPIRTFVYTNQSFTNSTTQKKLYLLASTDGIYSSFQIVNGARIPLSGAIITIERQFSGIWTVIGQEITGDDGLITFWVNPNYNHRITTIMSGYDTNQVTITPSQTLYTITLGSSTTGATYISGISGVDWTVFPFSGVIDIGVRGFNATVISSKTNLINCKFELLNASNIAQILNSSTSITNSSYCFVGFVYNASTNGRYFGRLSLNTTTSGGWVIVDTDWKWITIDQDIKGWRKITSLFSDLKTIGDFGDDSNKAEFSRFMFFFIVLTILITMFHYFTSIDINNPGISIIIIWGICLLASIGGFLTFESGSNNISPWIEQYGFSLLMSLITINYFITTLRREQE